MPETIATKETKGIPNPSIVPNVAIVTQKNVSNRNTLQRELEFLQAQYQACLNVRNSREYPLFSEATRRHGAKAIERLEKRMGDVQAMLSS